MTFKLDALFDSPDKQYLDANDLSTLSQYVSSIPERMAVYRTLRDWEQGISRPDAAARAYAAILREIQVKGTAARFKKTDRGLFTTNA